MPQLPCFVVRMGRTSERASKLQKMLPDGMMRRDHVHVRQFPQGPTPQLLNRAIQLQISSPCHKGDFRVPIIITVSGMWPEDMI